MNNKNYQKEFSKWLLNVIPSSYFALINEDNVNSRLDEIKTRFKESFGVDDLYEIDVNEVDDYSEQLRKYCSNKDGTPFGRYNQNMSGGMPNALINTHFICYINALNKQVKFKDAKELVALINEKLGQKFCNDFQETRKKLLGKARSATKGQLFKIENREDWFINEGGGCELQYHCAFYPDSKRVIYGLGFNTQYVPYVNDIMPEVTPYMKAYLNKQKECLKHMYQYRYLEGNEEQLIHPQRGQYTLLGKSIEVFNNGKAKDDADFSYFVNQVDFEMLLYNLKEWIHPYQIILEERNRLVGSAQQLIKTTDKKAKMLNPIQKVLELKKQIILQGAPGTGKTFKTAELAVAVCDPDFNDFKDRTAVMRRYNELKSEKRIVFTTFHQSMDYEEFVEGLKPVSTPQGVTFEPKAGLFKDLSDRALLSTIALSKNISTELEYDDIYDGLIERINSGEIKGLPTKTGQKIVGLKITAQNNIQFRAQGGGDRRYIVSKERLRKLFLHFDTTTAVDGMENINDEVREVIGGCQSSGYWAVLNYIVGYKRTSSEESVDIDNLSNKEQESAVQAFIHTPTADRVCNPDRPNYVLIIDEINRGNISKILGELITLLEADKRISEDNELTVKLPYSQKMFGVPSNLYIIGTMNTADRSVGYIDYAIRRRFGFVTIKSDFEVIAGELKDDVQSVAKHLYHAIKELMKQISPEFNADDLMIGHSYFIAQNLDELDLKLENEIKPLLREYVNDGILNLQKDSTTGQYTAIEELSIKNNLPSDA